MSRKLMLESHLYNQTCTCHSQRELGLHSTPPESPRALHDCLVPKALAHGHQRLTSNEAWMSHCIVICQQASEVLDTSQIEKATTHSAQCGELHFE